MTRWAPALVVGVVATMLLSGCGENGAGAAGDRSVTVFAASSLTESFTEAGAAYERQEHGKATFSFAGSQDLSAQIGQGAPADVLATADTATMQAVRSELAEAPTPLAHNRLVIVTAAGNPHQIATLSDLAGDRLVVVLADPTVPAGRYAEQALGAAHVRVQPRSLEPDVRSVLTKVELGEADAGIVYATDAMAAGDKVSTVPIADGPTAAYEIAAVSSRGRAFVAFMLSGEGQQILRRHGFLPP